MSVYYLIPWKDTSARLPDKNHLLLEFTLEHLRAEKVDFRQVFTFGKDTPPPCGVEHVKLESWEDTSHMEAVGNTLIHLAPTKDDIIV